MGGDARKGTEVTKTIELPEPAAHMYPSDLEKFKDAETFAQAYSVAVGCPDERSVPLFTLHDMVAYANACVAAERLMPLMDTPLAIRFDALDEAQAQANHGQTLDRLRQRGGLELSEAAAIREKRKWEPMTHSLALHVLSTPNV